MRELAKTILKNIFAYGYSILVAAAFIIAAGYIICFITGQPFSVSYHHLMSEKVLPVIYVSSIILSFAGIIYLYVSGEHTFRLDVPTHKKKGVSE